jgi:hypothetical protein
LKPVHVQADGNIVTANPGSGLTFFKHPVPEGNGCTADFKYANLQLDIIAVTERPAEIDLQVNRGQSEAVGIDHRVVCNSQLSLKELFQGDMKIMQKPGIIDNSGTIDITEANNQLRSEGYVFFPLNTFFNSLYPDFCHSPSVFRPLSSVSRPLFSDTRHLKTLSYSSLPSYKASEADNYR